MSAEGSRQCRTARRTPAASLFRDALATRAQTDAYGISFRHVWETKASAPTRKNSEESISGNWAHNFWGCWQSMTHLYHILYKPHCPDHLRELRTNLAHLHNIAGQTLQGTSNITPNTNMTSRSEGRGSRTKYSSLGKEEASSSLNYLAAKPFTSAIIHTSAAPPNIQTRCTRWTWHHNAAQNIQRRAGKQRITTPNSFYPHQWSLPQHQG